MRCELPTARRSRRPAGRMAASLRWNYNQRRRCRSAPRRDDFAASGRVPRTNRSGSFSHVLLAAVSALADRAVMNVWKPPAHARTRARADDRSTPPSYVYHFTALHLWKLAMFDVSRHLIHLKKRRNRSIDRWNWHQYMQNAVAVSSTNLASESGVFPTGL